MKKDNIEPIDEDPMEDFISTDPPDIFEEDDDEESDSCPYFDIIMHTILLSRPFGIIWNDDKMESFLIKRGYKIIEKHYTDKDRKKETYRVAIKSGSCNMPVDEISNIRDVFDLEIQDVILGWLDKIA